MFLKALLCIFLSCSTFAFAQVNGAKGKEGFFDVAISLGGYCQVARQMGLNKIRYQAFPFDWAMSPFDSVFQFINNRASGFLDQDKLIYVKGKFTHLYERLDFIEDSVYHLQLLHDFEVCENFLKDYATVKAKYERRIDRFFSALQSNKRILFIRHGITYLQAVLLDQLLHTRYPGLSYTILALDNTEEIKTDWKLERVKNCYLKQHTPWVWWGDDAAWKAILAPFSVSVIESVD